MPEEDRWDQLVYSDSFNRYCEMQSRRLACGSNDPELSYHHNLRDTNDTLTWVDPSSHGVSKLESHLYYTGLRGRGKRGPKLIYRTSTDIFLPPSGPFQEVRERQLLTVHEHPKLSQDNLWATIRDETVELLDRKNIKFTSVDLVRFRWEEQTENSPYYKNVTSPVTIWIGVLPDSTNGNTAFDSAQDILQLLNRFNIDDIDIAYRESEAQLLAGPTLYAPVDHHHPLKSVIGCVTTPLSVPITGLTGFKTRHIQGTLGFYFKIDNDLYGVTARHILFPDTEGNEPYSYDPAAPKKHVVLMGGTKFNDFFLSIQALIGSLNMKITLLEKNVKSYTTRVEGGNQQAVVDLAKVQQKLDETRKTIVELKKFYATLKRDWSKVNDRIIGHVVWAPPITGLTAPHGYTQDVCVIKLDKERFLPNFKGNAIDLGTEMELGKLSTLLYPLGVPSEFDYPWDRMYVLKTILAAAKIKEPNSQDSTGDPAHFVFKRGSTTLTTIGRLNGFESRQRRYSLFGNFDSVEAAVCPYGNGPGPFSQAGPFSQGGDSGAAIVGPNNDFIAQLTGGTGLSDYSDIIYGTPMEWLWNDVIKVKFPNAELFFDVPTDNELLDNSLG